MSYNSSHANNFDLTVDLSSISALSDLGLFGVAAFGLRQFTLTKRGLQQNSELARVASLRESIKLAADQCLAYTKDILPLITSCNQVFESMGLDGALDLFTVEIVDDGVIVKAPKSFPDGFDPGLFDKSEVVNAYLSVYNALEVFSVMFTKRIAAEEVAFSSVGRSFCFNVKRQAPLNIPLAGPNDFPGTGYYYNLLSLYLVWKKRLDRMELLQKEEEISKQLAQTHTVKIDPIGTNPGSCD